MMKVADFFKIISKDEYSATPKYLVLSAVMIEAIEGGLLNNNVNYTGLKKRVKVFLLFNKLSAHKKNIYDSFVTTLVKGAIIDLYIYNNDFSITLRPSL